MMEPEIKEFLSLVLLITLMVSVAGGIYYGETIYAYFQDIGDYLSLILLMLFLLLSASGFFISNRINEINAYQYTEILDLIKHEHISKSQVKQLSKSYPKITISQHKKIKKQALANSKQWVRKSLCRSLKNSTKQV